MIEYQVCMKTRIVFSFIFGVSFDEKCNLTLLGKESGNNKTLYL